jgi:hypothetical protein
MEMWIQAIVQVYCRRITYIDLPTARLNYLFDFRMELPTTF